MKKMISTVLGTAAFSIALTGCNPTVAIKAPEKPITVNLNIQHNIRIKVDKEINKSIAKNKDILLDK